jgi:hypothetical protein
MGIFNPRAEPQGRREDQQALLRCSASLRELIFSRAKSQGRREEQRGISPRLRVSARVIFFRAKPKGRREEQRGISPRLRVSARVIFFVQSRRDAEQSKKAFPRGSTWDILSARKAAGTQRRAKRHFPASQRPHAS